MKTTKIITLTTLVTIMLFSINSYSQRGQMGKGMQSRPTFNTFDLDGNYTGPNPNHTKETHYHYNSFNQITQSETPDASTTTFVYDDIQRLRFSQNAKQKAANKAIIVEKSERSKMVWRDC